jgi:ABC-2 type transport system ATP-binding protein
MWRDARKAMCGEIDRLQSRPMSTIEINGLTKRFGEVLAVDDLTFELRSGHVAGFLGPNGAGKTTTLRMALGLVEPTCGTVTFDGVRYRELRDPIGSVGAVLESSSFHPSRTARSHLRVVAEASRRSARRADELLELVGLADAADRRVGGYSLGMRQRLGLATALVGDPGVLILDEPTNGLDPAGVRWLRDLLHRLSEEGRTVLVSSHLLAEVAQTVDHLVIIHHGRLVSAGPVAEVIGDVGPGVSVRTPDAATLAAALRAAGVRVEQHGDDRLVAIGATPDVVGRAVAASGVVLYEMRLTEGSLEDTFLRLTNTKDTIR